MTPLNYMGAKYMNIFNLISLDKSSKVPLYIQLFEKIRDMIQDGTLLADNRLPSIRQLADHLQVNQVTVVSSYKQLENEGYAYSRPGSGTYVANIIPLLNNMNQSQPHAILDELYMQDDLLLISNGQIKLDDTTINFASATPTPDLFPVEDFKVVMNEVLDRDKGNAFGYQDSQGFYPLRECISQVLQRNIEYCTPDNTQIISGAQQGIDIISKAFLRQGDCVITESPTYTGAIAVFKSRGAEVIGTDMEEDGPNLGILEYNLKKYKPKLIYTIPSFQNPTGYTYSLHKRQGILNLAEKYGAFIIEDDYVSDLDFESRNIIPLKALDKYNRVIFIKSFSKIFMPGLRLGFMVVPSSLHGNILEAKHTTDISTSGIIQRAFDLYIRKGYWDKHFQFMYKIYKDRYLKTTESLDKYLPKAINYTKPGGGLNIWLSLPYGMSSTSLLNQASSSNIVFAPGKIFYSNNACQKMNHIRISFAAVYSEQIDTGIEKLCGLISHLQQKQDSYKNMPIL